MGQRKGPRAGAGSSSEQLGQKHWGKGPQRGNGEFETPAFFNFMEDYLWLQDTNNNTAARITEKKNIYISISHPLVDLEIPS